MIHVSDRTIRNDTQSCGRIVHRRCAATGKIVAVDCFNRDGWRLDDCTPACSAV